MSVPMNSCLLSPPVEEVKLLLYEHWEQHLKHCITTPIIKISVLSNINVPININRKNVNTFPAHKASKKLLVYARWEDEMKMRCPLQVHEPARIPSMIQSNLRDSTQCANLSSFQDTGLVQHLSIRNWINKPYISLLQQQISVLKSHLYLIILE